MIRMTQAIAVRLDEADFGWRKMLTRLLHDKGVTWVNEGHFGTSTSLTEIFRKLIALGQRKDPSFSRETGKILEAVIHDMCLDLQTKSADGFTSLIQQNCCVLSLAGNRSETLLWSHYSASHTGFAIEYDFSRLPSEDLRRRWLWPVIYVEKMFNLCQTMAAYSRERHMNVMWPRYASIHKSSGWKYEQEWRMVIPLEVMRGDQNVRMPTPTSITLGAKASSKSEEQMREFATVMGCRLDKVHFQPGDYEPNFETLDL